MTKKVSHYLHESHPNARPKEVIPNPPGWIEPVVSDAEIDSLKVNVPADLKEQEDFYHRMVADFVEKNGQSELTAYIKREILRDATAERFRMLRRIAHNAVIDKARAARQRWIAINNCNILDSSYIKEVPRYTEFLPDDHKWKTVTGVFVQDPGHGLWQSKAKGIKRSLHTYTPPKQSTGTCSRFGEDAHSVEASVEFDHDVEGIEGSDTFDDVSGSSVTIPPELRQLAISVGALKPRRATKKSDAYHAALNYYDKSGDIHAFTEHFHIMWLNIPYRNRVSAKNRGCLYHVGYGKFFYPFNESDLNSDDYAWCLQRRSNGEVNTSYADLTKDADDWHANFKAVKEAYDEEVYKITYLDEYPDTPEGYESMNADLAACKLRFERNKIWRNSKYMKLEADFDIPSDSEYTHRDILKTSRQYERMVFDHQKTGKHESFTPNFHIMWLNVPQELVSGFKRISNGRVNLLYYDRYKNRWFFPYNDYDAGTELMATCKHYEYIEGRAAKGSLAEVIEKVKDGTGAKELRAKKKAAKARRDEALYRHALGLPKLPNSATKK